MGLRSDDGEFSIMQPEQLERRRVDRLERENQRQQREIEQLQRDVNQLQREVNQLCCGELNPESD